LPKLIFCAGVDDTRDAAEQIYTTRTIRAGRDAWEQIGRAESFDAWKSIGAALAIGKTHALRTTGANAPWGQNYSREFGKWMQEHGFANMIKATRSYSISLHENAEAIEAWRLSLPERERRLVNPQSVVRRWRKETRQPSEGPSQNRLAVAIARSSWKRFATAMQTLPPDERQSLWHEVSAEIQAM
jgi:hypothetical protein